MSLVAIVALSIGCFAYLFWPQRNPFVQADKTRVDYLRERKEAIDENLRDLHFEFLAGKYPEADYNQQRRALEDEAERTVAEMELLTAGGMKSRRAKA
jgi:cob(I)alamin adenosyltransferase